MIDLILLRPLWLLLLIPLAVLTVMAWRRPAALGTWRRAVDPGLMRAMADIGRVPQARAGSAVLRQAAIATLILTALAGPAMLDRDAPAFRNLDGVVLVMDVSRSVTEDGHLPALVTAARSLLTRLNSRPAGLVVFAGDAYIADPITTDTRQIGFTLALLEEGVIPDPGSRPARGLDLARGVLEAADIIAGDVALFTDGAAIDPPTLASAAQLAARDARLWVVTPDTPDAAAATLAARGGGLAFAAMESGPLARALNAERSARLARSDIAMLYRAELGRWLLLPALCLMALAFRRAA